MEFANGLNTDSVVRVITDARWFRQTESNLKFDSRNSVYGSHT